MQKLEVLYDGETWQHDFPSENLTDFIQWFQDKLDKIPPEYRDSATVDFSTYDDETNIRLQVSYLRPETKEESELRLKLEAERLNTLRQYELKQLEKLKAKYPGA